MMKEENVEVFTVCKTLQIPAPVSALSFGVPGHLFAGSGTYNITIQLQLMSLLSIDDGTLRVYDLSTFRVIKAIRGLGEEVSSIVCMKRTGSMLRDAWVAHGTKVSPYNSWLWTPSWNYADLKIPIRFRRHDPKFISCFSNHRSRGRFRHRGVKRGAHGSCFPPRELRNVDHLALYQLEYEPSRIYTRLW